MIFLENPPKNNYTQQAVNKLYTYMNETTERGTFDDSAIASIQSKLSDFHNFHLEFEDEFNTAYWRVRDYLELRMPNTEMYGYEHQKLSKILSNTREGMHAFSYDTSELQYLITLIKRNVSSLQQTVALSFTDSFRMSVSSATGFRTQMNDLHRREIDAKRGTIDALLAYWEGQDPATVLVNLERPLSEEAQLAWVEWTGSTEMLTPEERDMLGRQQSTSGAWRVAGGIAAIILTGGKSIPFQIAGSIIGGYSIISGTSDIIEGGHNMWLGSQEDVTTSAVNPLLNTIYGGNRDLYNTVNTFVGMTNWVFIGTSFTIPNRQTPVILSPENIRIMRNGRPLHTSNQFVGFRTNIQNIQNPNVPRMINVNGRWVVAPVERTIPPPPPLPPNRTIMLNNGRVVRLNTVSGTFRGDIQNVNIPQVINVNGRLTVVRPIVHIPDNLTNFHVPSVRNGEFNQWFDALTPKQFNRLWSDPTIRATIERRIRRPGGYHEWHLVARTPRFKEWGISMNDIKEMRTLISDIEFRNPHGVHGGLGSTTAHKEILRLIDGSSNYEQFVRLLNNWAEYRLRDGVLGLPEGLRR